MKLLLLVHRLPCPPDRGSKLRSSLELHWLAERHDVWCAGFWESADRRNPEGVKAMAALRSVCRDVCAVPLRPFSAEMRAVWSLAHGRTATEGYFASLQLERKVLAWADQVGFDAVLAFSSSMAPLALRVPARRRVLDMVDLDSRKWAETVEQSWWPMSAVYRTEAQRLERCEREWIGRFDATVLVNRREADLLEPSLRSRVHVIETGHAFRPPSESDWQAQMGSANDLPDEPVVGFVGAMDYPPNIDAACWFAEAIWPRIQARRDDAQWWIVGRSPTRPVRRLDDGRNIRVTGTVPAIEPYFARMRVTVAPLRLARGVQTKVLAAMAAGRPCVVTPCVAEGIGAEPGRELLVAESPDDFAAAVVDLLNHRVKARAIAHAGQMFVTQRYRPEEGLERLEALLTAPVIDRERVPAGSSVAARPMRQFVPVLGKHHRGGSL